MPRLGNNTSKLTPYSTIHFYLLVQFSHFMTEENQSEQITFYSFYNTLRDPESLSYSAFRDIELKDAKYPCIILNRDNGWNDYSYYTLFFAVYLPNDKEVIDLGVVKIIQTDPEIISATNGSEGKYTKLPPEFKVLPKDKFLSRGVSYFYNKLRNMGQLMNQVLSALNDVHYFNYTHNQIIAIDEGKLYSPYLSSLYRNDLTDLEISSEYAKHSLNMLKEIDESKESLKKLSESEQKILKKLLYGSVIAALESYLGDAFKYHVTTNDYYFNSFLTNFKYPEKDKK